MNQVQYDFIVKAKDEAQQAQHIYPDMAACEAALESNYGQSRLCTAANNLFGTKQHTTPIYDTLSLPTKEFLNGIWVTVTARWVKYPDWASCFKDRMDTLKRLAPSFPHYKAALEAKDPTTYVLEVSKTWATDPDRGNKVLNIYSEYAKHGITVNEADKQQ